jgi:hypothetical protein
MKILTQQSTVVRLEAAIMIFFVLAVLCLLVVYIVDPSIYVQTLLLHPSATDRHPLIATLFMVAILAFITLLSIGVMRRWRWLFWLLLIAFAASIIQIPVTLLQIAGVLPAEYPLWYTLFRLFIAFVELCLAMWMVQIYRREGVWGLGRRKIRR